MSDVAGGSEAGSIISTDNTKIMNSNPLEHKIPGILDSNPLEHLTGSTIGKLTGATGITSSFDPNNTIAPNINSPPKESLEKVGLKGAGRSF
jgi:hypothetical protein